MGRPHHGFARINQWQFIGPATKVSLLFERITLYFVVFELLIIVIEDFPYSSLLTYNKSRYSAQTEFEQYKVIPTYRNNFLKSITLVLEANPELYNYKYVFSILLPQ